MLCTTNRQNACGLYKFPLRGTGFPPVITAETAVPLLVAALPRCVKARFCRVAKNFLHDVILSEAKDLLFCFSDVTADASLPSA